MTTTPPLTPDQRAEFEKTYRQLCSSIVTMAALLGKPSPLKTHDERRAERHSLQAIDIQRSQ